MDLVSGDPAKAVGIVDQGPVTLFLSFSVWPHGRFQNAVAFADGIFALSRPVKGSFVIVKGEKSLEKTAIGINPDYAGRFKALSTLFGPAVVPNLTNYRLNKIDLEPVNPPLGGMPDEDGDLHRIGDLMAIRDEIAPPQNVTAFHTEQGK